MMAALREFNERNGSTKSPLEGIGTPVPRLHYWSTCGRTWGVKQALIAGEDIDEMTPFGTALHTSAENGHIEIVQLLVEQGADIGLRDVEGRTALDAALQRGHDAVADFLQSVMIDRGLSGTDRNEARSTGRD